MADSLSTLASRLLLRCPSVGPFFAEDLIRDSFREICQRRDWTWRRRYGTLYPSSFSSPGTMSISPGSAVVTGSGTSFSDLLIGRQFRVSTSYPTFTVVRAPSSTSLILDRPWVGPTVSGSSYSLFQCYFQMPSDFDHWVSLTNPADSYKLFTSISQSVLDRYDPQRTQSSQAWSVAYLDHQTEYVGTVGDTLQVRGSGPAPVATTTLGYSYPLLSAYVIEIVTGGAVDTAEFTWRQDSDTASPAILSSSDPIDLSNGVQIYFPAGTYVDGDIFVITCTPGSTLSSPRYEFWPRPINNSQIYSYCYIAAIPELTDESPNLPPGIASRGDVILERALMKCAEFPGIGETRNPYYDLALAKRHEIKSERMINELEMRDEDISREDLQYTCMPYAPAPWLDGSFQQAHDIGSMY